jgi:hypothetical protein
MSDGSSVMNIGDLAKPATALIEKIAGAIGVYWEPHQIRRVAQANADAALIKANAEIDITDIATRAMRRWVQEQVRYQENIESITSLAIPSLKTDSNPSEVDDDWIVHFFEKCRLVSDTDMQALWARILAGEANEPESFSKRTIDALSVLDKHDAELFQKLCRFNWSLCSVDPLIYGPFDSIYTDNGLTSEVISHLDDIGLINFAILGFGERNLRGRAEFRYFDAGVTVTFPVDHVTGLDTGHVIFSRVGRQLNNVCSSIPVPGFLEYVTERWTSAGLDVKVLAPFDLDSGIST